MNATSIVLLIGVCSFWILVGIVFSLLGRIKKVIEELESSLVEIRNDIAHLTPILSETLQGVDKAGEEIEHTAMEIRALTRKVNSSTVPSVIGGAVSYLPVAMTVLKFVKPLFGKMRKGSNE